MDEFEPGRSGTVVKGIDALAEYVEEPIAPMIHSSRIDKVHLPPGTTVVIGYAFAERDGQRLDVVLQVTSDGFTNLASVTVMPEVARASIKWDE